jgi:hypothetical protein
MQTLLLSLQRSCNKLHKFPLPQVECSTSASLQCNMHVAAGNTLLQTSFPPTTKERLTTLLLTAARACCA